jgi:hypothetical protein
LCWSEKSPSVLSGSSDVPKRWPQIKETFLTIVAGFGQPEFTSSDARNYVYAAAIAKNKPRPFWSGQAAHVHANAVAERQRLFDQYKSAKAKGQAEQTGRLTLAVAEATHDEAVQLRQQRDDLQAQLAENTALLKEVHATTVMGASPVDLSEQSASAQLAVNYATQRVKQNQARELRVHATHERKKTYDEASAGMVESRNEYHKHYKALREKRKEFDTELALMGRPIPKQTKVSSASASGVLRSFDICGAGFAAFKVTLTSDTTADELKETIATHLGTAAPAIDAMKLMLGRKPLGAGTRGVARVKDGASLTLVTSKEKAKGQKTNAMGRDGKVKAKRKK